MSNYKSENEGVASYANLRRAIGCLGIGLPIACFIHSMIHDQALEMSISTYYHTGIRDLFVGILYVLGSFLLTYDFRREDLIPTLIAGCSAFLITVFCTSAISQYEHRPGVKEGENTLHVIFAGALFLSFAYMSICLFTRTHTGSTGRGFLKLFRDPKKESVLPEPKQKRNRVYRACGWIIVVCVAMIALNSGKGIIPPSYNPTYWFETISLFSFGFSWLIKGETLWQDNTALDGSEDTSEPAYA